MPLEVELDFEQSPRVRNGPSGQTARVDVKSNVPPLIQRRGKNHADLADDLHPHVHGAIGFLPFMQRKRRPPLEIAHTISVVQTRRRRRTSKSKVKPNRSRPVSSFRMRMSFIENLSQDVRFAVRQLRNSWVFTCTAVVVLALGMAASVAIFAFVDAALIKP